MINYPLAFVLYNPSQNSVNRIIDFANKGCTIYIYDNSSSKNEELSKTKNISYFSNNINHGLSYCLKFLCDIISKNSVNKFLFFDQDTIFTLDTLNYIEDFENFMSQDNKILFNSVASVNFRDNTVANCKYNLIETIHIDNYIIQYVYFNINSGTMYFLDNFNSFNWFDNQYFVDGVDYAFSLNAFINKFKNVSITNVPGLNHFDEQGDSTIIFCNKKITSRVYPLNRNLDYIYSHLRLFIKTFKINSIKPKIFILKAIIGYTLTQIIFRLHSIINNK